MNKKLVSIRALMGKHLPSVRPDYKTILSAECSGAFDLVHEIDLAIWFAGQPVQDVYSLYGTYSDIGIKGPDIVEILIGFKERCMAEVHLDNVVAAARLCGEKVFPPKDARAIRHLTADCQAKKTRGK